MRTLTIIFCFVSSILSAQLKVDSITHKLSFEKLDTVDLKKQEIKEVAEKWFVVTFVDSKDLISTNLEENGQLSTFNATSLITPPFLIGRTIHRRHRQQSAWIDNVGAEGSAHHFPVAEIRHREVVDGIRLRAVLQTRPHFGFVNC